jgi:hypothetical protein
LSEDDAFVYGIPYPGVYVTDTDGVVVAKFFHDSYKKRDSPETLIDAALGKIVLSDGAPQVTAGDPKVRVTVAVQGGKGSIRQGIIRQLVVRFELSEGLHLYGRPVPEGMIPTTVSVEGPPGLVIEETEYPPTSPMHLASLNLDLPVWSGSFDVVVPLYAVGELASETRPLDTDRSSIEVTVRYQACDDNECLLPKTEKLKLDLAMDVIDVPALGVHMGHGQREASFDGTPHARPLILRTLRRSPLGVARFALKILRLELEARKRQRGGE